MTSTNGILRSGIEKLRGDYLLARLSTENVPAHVAIIMDGNGRWAARRGLPRLEGHRAGGEAIRGIVAGATEAGVKYLTLYTFSSENWARPPDEVAGLMDLFTEMLEREIDELDAQQVRLRVLGRLDEVPDTTRNAFEVAQARTAQHDRFHLILALNYGGRREIADAVRGLAREVAGGQRNADAIDEDALACHLYLADVPDPDLLVRSGGNLRISNFMLWQVAYAELWMTEKLWPDFRRRDLFRALRDYQHRERRFGRVTTDG